MGNAVMAFDRLLNILLNGQDNSLSSAHLSTESNRYRIIIDCSTIQRDDYLTTVRKFAAMRYTYAGQVVPPVE